MLTKYEVIILPLVERQVEKIAKYIAKENLSAAKAFIAVFEKQMDSLETVPSRAALIPENDRWGTGYRQLLNGDYRTIFRVFEKSVIIVSLVHGSQKINKRSIHE